MAMNNDDLYLEQLLVGPMDNFIYLIGSKSTREVAIIDPAWDIDALLNHIKEKELKFSNWLKAICRTIQVQDSKTCVKGKTLLSYFLGPRVGVNWKRS